LLLSLSVNAFIYNRAERSAALLLLVSFQLLYALALDNYARALDHSMVGVGFWYNRNMTKVVGPCFSLEASGILGDAILFNPSKNGVSRVQVAPRYKKKCSPEFKENQVRFKDASDRWRVLYPEQREAWKVYAWDKCDTGRAQFMGYQIDKWTAWHGNDVSWCPDPTYYLPDVYYFIYNDGSAIEFGLDVDSRTYRAKYHLAYFRFYASSSADNISEDAVVIYEGPHPYGFYYNLAAIDDLPYIWINVIRTNGNSNTVGCLGNFKDAYTWLDRIIQWSPDS